MLKYIIFFYKPFLITYIFLSIGLGFYPTFNFFSLKGQIILIFTSSFNGVLGVYYLKKIKK